MKKVLVLMDFDGTITNKDSFIEFIRFYTGTVRFILGLFLLSPLLFLYKLKLIPNWKAKEIVLLYFFKNVSFKTFSEKASLFSVDRIPKIIKKNALEKIHWHQAEGHQVIIVTASIDCYLKQWCIDNNLELIASTLQVNENKITGKLKSPNCYGEEKVNRIRSEIDLKQFEYIYAYGDSRGDKEMLALANLPHFKFFK
jgi:phosphatidylglycerophosphatase C